MDINEIKSNIAKLKCGSDQGTAFLIDKKKAITALHCINDYSEENIIELEFKHLDEKKLIKAIPLNIKESKDKNLDLIVLELEEEVYLKNYIKLSKEDIFINEKWVSYGYPQLENEEGLILSGNIEGKTDSEGFDIIIKCDESVSKLNGFSGAPLIVEGELKGIIKYNRNKRNTLGALSIKCTQGIFEKLGINIYEKKEEKFEIVENWLTTEKIIECVNNNESGYIFIKGVPGSGKTTFTYNFDLEHENIEVLGKYFLKNINEEYNIQYNSDTNIFGNWILENISKYLYKELRKPEIKNELELIQLISKYFTRLSDENKRVNKKTIFFIDGIDEILILGKERIDLFFSILPSNLKENIFIVILGNNENLIAENIQKKEVLNMSSLEEDKILPFLNNQLILKNIDLSVSKKIVEKSEGNPLYLRYLIDYLNTQKSITSSLIEEIPIISGEINKYYEFYWKKIISNKELINMLAIISRVRKFLLKDELLKILPQEEKYTFTNNLSLVSHLINENKNRLKIYHTSFENFIKEKTEHLNEEIHEVISKFCIENSNNIYSLENKLYHLINSKEEFRKKAIEFCNQEWLDLCSMKNIDLELMAIDIRRILSLSIIEGNFSDVINILLLLQRFEFRNEKLFRTFAVEIAKALYEMGREREVLNYILYKGVLIDSISNKDIKYFLHRFFEDNFEEEGKKLLKAIELKIINNLEKNNVTLDLLSLDIQSTFYTSPEKAFRKLEYYKKNLENGEEIKEIIISEQIALWIKQTKKYVGISTLNKEINKDIVKNIDFLNKIIFYYLDMQEEYFSYEENEGFNELIKDLECCLEKVNIEKNSNLIEALIQFSKNIFLLEKLIQSEEKPSFSLRKENGVDFNYIDYNNYRAYYIYRGYVVDYELIEDPEKWEELILNIIKKSCNNLGACYRAKATSDKEQLEKIYDRILEVLECLKIDFRDRANWERSYFIPEHIIPLIYKDIANIFVQFFPNKIEELINYLENNYQLGLYNEGYRRVLFVIIKEIIKDKKTMKKAFILIKKLEIFIEKYILNRWERNRDFLNIIELYAKIGSSERAEETFKKMLKTSMGPSWYKEAQLTLMLTGIENLKNLKNKEKYISIILGNLEYASGEMTFQRYVRDDKEQMVSIISKNLNKKSSFEYIKKMLNPSYKELLANTKKDTADIVKESFGYIQGTNEIDIQDSMIFFIKELKEEDYILKHALTEIFIQGDERYFDDYVKLQVKILKDLKIKNTKEYQELLVRIKRQFVVELDERKRMLFIKQLKDSDLEELLLEINKINVLKAPIEKSFMETNEGFQEKESETINLVKEEIEMDNKKQAKKILANKLVEINNEAGDIFNYSRESIECLNLLQKHCISTKEFIEYLKPIFSKTYRLNWELVNQLILRVGELVEEEEAKKVMEEILEHIELMLRVPQEYLEKYKWIEELTEAENEIEKFIVSLINLPDGVIYKTKAIEILIWLGKMRPNSMIPLLIENSLKNIKDESCEIIAGILHYLSKSELIEHIWYFIQLNDKIQSDILGERHFIIKSCYYEIGKLAKKRGLVKAEEFTTSLEKIMFLKKKKEHENDINLEGYSLYLNRNLCYILEELNKVIDVDQEFLDKLIFNFKEVITPLKIEEFRLIDEFFERSFSIPKGLSNKYNTVFINEINLLVSNYVTDNNYNVLKKLLRSYNPSFVESNYSLKIPDIYQNIEKILNGEMPKDENFLYYEDKLILDYNEIIADKKLKRGKRIEMTAFLIKNDKNYPDSKDKLFEMFSANLESDEILEEIIEGENVQPLVNKCIFSFCKNKWNTPSDIRLILKNNIDKEIKKTVWKSGTILDVEGFGQSLAEGSLLSVNKEVIEKLKLNSNYRLMYIISYNMTEKIIFLDYSKHKFIKVV
ncbi:MAG: trypsin-like peptidase domain-containing protein [Cetobacterium sp.]